MPSAVTIIVPARSQPETLPAFGRWPVRPAPLPDELLSSWLVRLIWKLGRSTARPISLRNLLGVVPDWRILDHFPPSTLLDRLAAGTGRTQRELSAATLFADPGRRGAATPVDMGAEPAAAFPGMAVFLGLAHGSPRWLLVDRVTARTPNAARGQCYCPACLSEDREPYYRRQWRMAFAATCVRHGLVLQDRCPACGASVRPFALKRLWLVDPDIAPVAALCWRCLFDLRRTAAMPADPAVATFERQALRTWNLAWSRGANIVGDRAFADHLWREYAGILRDVHHLDRRFGVPSAQGPQARHDALVGNWGYLALLFRRTFTVDFERAASEDILPWVAAPKPPRSQRRRWQGPSLSRSSLSTSSAYQPPPALLAWARQEVALRLPPGLSVSQARQIIPKLARALADECRSADDSEEFQV